MAGAPADQVPVGGGGSLPGAAEVVAMEADPGKQAVGVPEAVDLADLLGEFEAGFELGEGVIPLPGQEAPVGEVQLMGGQSPANAQFLADPQAGAKRGPGLLRPVKLDEDAPTGYADREAMSQAAGRATTSASTRSLGIAICPAS